MGKCRHNSLPRLLKTLPLFVQEMQLYKKRVISMAENQWSIFLYECDDRTLPGIILFYYWSSHALTLRCLLSNGLETVSFLLQLHWRTCILSSSLHWASSQQGPLLSTRFLKYTVIMEKVICLHGCPSSEARQKFCLQCFGPWKLELSVTSTEIWHYGPRWRWRQRMSHWILRPLHHHEEKHMALICGAKFYLYFPTML